MRILIYTVLSLALASSAFAQDQAKKSPTQGDEKSATEGTLSTPFGVAKTTKPPASKTKTKAAKVRQNWQVAKDGKDFKFTKKTPFGPSSWTRTEAELTADERAVAEQHGLIQPKDEPAEEPETETAVKQL